MVGLGMSRARADGRGRMWPVPTRLVGVLVDECDERLEHDSCYLESAPEPDAEARMPGVVAFLRRARHEAIPLYVDDWVARDRSIHQWSPKSGLDGPVHHVLTRRHAGLDGWRYLQGRREPGGGLPPALALRIVGRLADACRLAHAAGVVHGGLLLSMVRIGADGTPQLGGWASARQGVGNLGCDFEWLWGGLRDVLGAKAPVADPRGDIFALGSMLCTLVTGHPSFEPDERHRWWYRAPSSVAPRYAWLDDLVARACDPARGFTLDAGALAQRIEALRVERVPTEGQVRSDLQRGEFGTLAELVAHAGTAGALGPDVSSAVTSHVLGALRAERAMPRFAELAVAASPESRPALREHVASGEGPASSRHLSLLLLAMADDEATLRLALAQNEPGWPIGWSKRPQLVNERGEPCPHPWTSLRGEPRYDEQGGLQRDCGHCGTVYDALSWLERRWRATPRERYEPPVTLLRLRTTQGARELQPWVPYRLGTDASDMLCVPSLDPAHHLCFYALDDRRVRFTFGTYKLSFLDGHELRCTVLDTTEPDAELRVGPLRFAAAAPGELDVQADCEITLKMP
jgi:hypothetical protein